MAPATEQTIVQIPLKKIHPDPNNPRKIVTVDDDFVDSIRAHGILQAITVRPHPDKAGEFMICFGERRWTGAGKAPLKTAPCVVRDDLDPGDILETQLIENDARDAITPMDEARALVSLVRDHGRPQRELAKRLGKSQPYLSKHMSLALRLPGAGQALLDSGGIKVTDAILLASLHEHPDRIEKIIDAFRRSGPDDKSWAGGPRVLAEQLEDVKHDKEHRAALKKLEDAGVEILDAKPAWTASVGLGAGAFGVEVDPDLHAKEPCHRGWVSNANDTSFWCADRDRHAPDGDSKLKAPNLAPPPPPAEGDNPISEFAEKLDQVGAAGVNANQADHEAAVAKMQAERLERQKQREADELIRHDIVGARRAFIREHLAGTSDDPAALGAAVDLTHILGVYVLTTADTIDGTTDPDPRLAADLLGYEHVELDEYIDYELTIQIDEPGHFLATHPNQVAAALAIALTVGEDRLPARGEWDDRTFADIRVRRHLAYLQAHGYQPAELEQQLLAAGDAYRTVSLPHPFTSTGDNEAEGRCDICGQDLGASRIRGFSGYRHTDAEERYEAIDAAEAADVCPVFVAFDTARSALELKENKKGRARIDAVTVFDQAKDAFASRLVDALPDPTDAARRLREASDGYCHRLNTVGPVRTTHQAEDLAAYQEFTDEVLAVLETTGPLPAALHKVIAERSELRLSEPPTTRAGVVKNVHVADLLERLDLRAPQHTAEDFELAARIPGYYEFTDDEAVAHVAGWVDEHDLDLDAVTALLRVEQANEEAIDRPFLRAALVKIIASKISGVTLTEPEAPADDSSGNQPDAAGDEPRAAPELTKARLAGLTVLAYGHAKERTVRESNGTTTGDITDGSLLTVYWMTTKWLIDGGYAVKASNGADSSVITLTEAGAALAADHDVLDGLLD